MKRNLSIDLVKIIAMFMVLMLHIGLLKPPNTTFYRCTHGVACIAIPLFFMVSGYLLSNKIPDFNYSIKKISRILLFIFKTTTLFIIIEYVFFNGNLLLLLRSYYNWFNQHGIMWHYWYFASMIFIYVSLPLLLKIIHSKYLGLSLIILVVISLCFFILDLFYDFERENIRQTYRIWYWLMFFFLGAYINLNQSKFKIINWKFAFCACFIYTLFQVSMVSYITANEFFFGSIFCMLYAITVFVACLNKKIKNNTVIHELSSLFLPVYAIHPYIISKLLYLVPYLNFSSIINYFTLLSLVVVINISIAFILMRIPYVKDIFKM